MKVTNPSLIIPSKNLNSILDKIKNGIDDINSTNFSTTERTEAMDILLNREGADDLRASLDIEGIRTTRGQTINLMKVLTINYEAQKMDTDSIKGRKELANVIKALRFITNQRSAELTEEFIKKVHAIINEDVLGAQYIGRYRFPGDVRSIAGAQVTVATPGEIENKMWQIVDYFKKYEKETSPIVMSAWLQHQIALVHPFHDGNGRTARMLTNWVLLKNYHFPYHQGEIPQYKYFDFLVNADQEIWEDFIGFIAQQQLDLISKFLAAINSIRTSKGIFDQALSSFRARKTSGEELDYAEWRGKQTSIISTFENEIKRFNRKAVTDGIILEFEVYPVPTLEVWKNIRDLGSFPVESQAFRIFFKNEGELKYKSFGYFAKHFPRGDYNEFYIGSAKTKFMDSVGLYIAGYQIPAPVDYPTVSRNFKFTISDNSYKFAIPHPDKNIGLRELLWIKQEEDEYYKYERPVTQYYDADDIVGGKDERTWDREKILLEEMPEEVGYYIRNILTVYI